MAKKKSKVVTMNKKNDEMKKDNVIMRKVEEIKVDVAENVDEIIDDVIEQSEVSTENTEVLPSDNDTSLKELLKDVKFDESKFEKSDETFNKSDEVIVKEDEPKADKKIELTADICRYKKSGTTVTAKALTKHMDKGVYMFDNTAQRSLVWSEEQKSNLIISMIMNVFVPPLYANRNTQDNTFDFLDGKQRSHAVHDYISGMYALKNVPNIALEDGTEIDLNGYYMNELPEDIQDYINDFTFDIKINDDLDADQCDDVFARLNSGKSLTAIEFSRVKAKDLSAIQSIASHEIFREAFTDKMRAKYVDEDIAVKSYIMINEKTPCLDTKFVRPYMELMNVTDDERKELFEVFDIILKASNDIKARTNGDTKKNAKIAKRILTRTHLVSLVGFVHKFKKEFQNSSKLADYCMYFYNSNASSIDDKYNSSARSGAGHSPQVKTRQDALEKYYKEFLSM